MNLERSGGKITELVTKTFLAVVFDRNQGFTHIRVRDIIACLFAEYSQVEYQNRVGNRSKLADPWDANNPFQELVQRVQEIQEFVTYGGRTIPMDNIADTIYTIVYNTGLFYDDCDKWYNKERADKTWANLQAHFQAEQRKYKRKKKYPPVRWDTTARKNSEKKGKTPTMPSLTWQERQQPTGTQL